MEYGVSIQINGQDEYAGTLYTHVRRGVESASFRYDLSFLAHRRSFPLAPDMPLSDGSLHTHGEALFRVFEDCMPNRWGRNLMLREERKRAKAENRAARSLFEHDFLAGVNDIARQGALRIWVSGTPVATESHGVPREISIPSLLEASDRAATDLNADVSDLVAAGSSLGGARPKASVLDESGELYIAKFPKVDELTAEDVCAWEKTALDLAALSGIRVPQSRLLRIKNRSVLLVKRFDRNKELRIPYLSGITAVQGTDGEHYSYLDLVSFIEEECCAPDADLHELWRRILFNCAIGNTDDHMRNHGFLREDNGWRLSPAFDINPTPGDNLKHLRSAIDFNNDEADPRVAVAASDWFRLKHEDAIAEAQVILRALKQWHKRAIANGISKASQDYMSSCLESGITRLAALR